MYEGWNRYSFRTQSAHHQPRESRGLGPVSMWSSQRIHFGLWQRRHTRSWWAIVRLARKIHFPRNRFGAAHLICPFSRCFRYLHTSSLPRQHVLCQVRTHRGGQVLHARVLREVLLPIVHGGRPVAGERAPPRQHEEKKKVYPAYARLRCQIDPSVFPTRVMAHVDSDRGIRGIRDRAHGHEGGEKSCAHPPRLSDVPNNRLVNSLPKP